MEGNGGGNVTFKGKHNNYHFVLSDSIIRL